MFKLTSKKLSKWSQSFMDELEDVDWGDDTPTRRRRIRKPQNRLPEEPIEQQPVQPERQPRILHDEYNLTDDIEEDAETFMDEMPLGRDNIEETPYTDPYLLVNDAMANLNIIQFEYTDRHGFYRGVRKVEPHFTFVAPTTNNFNVMCFDLLQNDIRTFIVGNIHPNGVRLEDENFDTNSRPEIWRGV